MTNIKVRIMPEDVLHDVTDMRLRLNQNTNTLKIINFVITDGRKFKFNDGTFHVEDEAIDEA
jgi:hypothetical protein